MDALSRAVINAKNQIEEALENARIRQSFKSFFIACSAELYAYSTMRPELRAELGKSLSRKFTGDGPTYRGLMIELHASIEMFIKSLLAARLENIVKNAGSFNCIDKVFQKNYIAHSGRILSRIADEDAVRFDYDSLLASIGSCLSSSSDYLLNAEVYVTPSPNCTHEKIEKLFKFVGMPSPFNDELGKNSALRRHMGGLGARETTKQVIKKLNKLVSERNTIAHGLGTLSVTFNDVEDAGEFFLALLEALALQAETSFG